MNEFKVDKGIPIPPKKIGRKPGKWKTLINSMEPGDSVAFGSIYNKASVLACLRSYAKIAARQDGEGFRVWLLEKKSK